MEKAYLISTGTELLIGSTIDTNSVFISQQLMDIGIKVIGKSIVGDNEESIRNAFQIGINCADIIISSGGLGPTFDDLTKKIACEVMDCKLELRDEEVKRLQDYFARRHRSMPDINLRQAMFPSESIVLKNPLGTAPGMYLNKNGKVLVLLPGPPREMEHMYLNELKPQLMKDFSLDSPIAITKTIKILGPGESQVEELIADIMKNPRGCSLALLAREGEVHIRITAEGKNQEHSQEILDIMTDEIVQKIGNNVFGYDNDTLISIVVDLLKKKGKIIACAESCTGGLLSKIITDNSGSSQYFWGSVISYSNDAKQKFLGVKGETLDAFGAVSEQTATEMAYGIMKSSGADLGVAITGIAGPEGGTPDKPVGLVYIGLADSDNIKTREVRFVGDRGAIRILAAKSALDLVRRHLQGK